MVGTRATPERPGAAGGGAGAQGGGGAGGGDGRGGARAAAGAEEAPPRPEEAPPPAEDGGGARGPPLRGRRLWLSRWEVRGRGRGRVGRRPATPAMPACSRKPRPMRLPRVCRSRGSGGCPCSSLGRQPVL